MSPLGCVVVTHAIGQNHKTSALPDQAIHLFGSFGVFVFFCISGFLLFRTYVAWILDDVSFPSYLWYLRRRLLRIIPLYWVVLTVYVLFVDGAKVGPGIGDKLRIYSLTQIYSFGRSLEGIFTAWTLCIEMGFYLSLPLIAWGLRWVAKRAGNDPRLRVYAIFGGISVLVAASLAWKVYYFEYADAFSAFRSIWPPAFLDAFAAGMALAAYSAAHQRNLIRVPSIDLWRETSWLCWVSAAGFFWIVMLARPFFSPEMTAAQELIQHYGLIAAGLLAVLPAISDETTVVGKIMEVNPLRYLGEVSYGLYLWHPAVVLTLFEKDPTMSEPARLLIVSAISIALAILSFEAIEKPTLLLKKSKWFAGTPPGVAPHRLIDRIRRVGILAR